MIRLSNKKICIFPIIIKLCMMFVKSSSITKTIITENVFKIFILWLHHLQVWMLLHLPSFKNPL